MRLLHLAHARAGLLQLWCTDQVWAGPLRGTKGKNQRSLLSLVSSQCLASKKERCKEKPHVRGFVFPCLTFPTPTKAVSFAAWLEYCLCKTCKAVLHAWKQSIRRGTITHMWGRPQTQKTDLEFRLFRLAKLLHLAEIECKCTGCKQFVNLYRMWWWGALPNFAMDCTEPDYFWIFLGVKMRIWCI